MASNLENVSIWWRHHEYILFDVYYHHCITNYTLLYPKRNLLYGYDILVAYTHYFIYLLVVFYRMNAAKFLQPPAS